MLQKYRETVHAFKDKSHDLTFMANVKMQNLEKCGVNAVHAGCKNI